ncbi:RNA polymerase sigma factor [Nitratireductor basaltis]|uniref:RNA polymerase ECF-subfamily sigma factor n=1 Tax=Nitratireductor basaltis TaxID=472175 RepID=A0A084U9E4_9HYPH|nr:RNA polymerase sigma factor [Nitratireductor basaltis]KFB09580.1 RNA polymerase ECF-subfamily sigma factor [Nitratireductor basaltis]
MSDAFAIANMLTGARPRAMAALLRYFRDLDLAEEAYQEACLRAVHNWPRKGPPRDPVGWLVFVGRNAAVDGLRRQTRHVALPAEDVLSDIEDHEAAVVEQMDEADYRDDILRLMFICAHPDLVAAQQVALALRIVSGLSVAEIAAAFLAKEKTIEQRITRAKRKVMAANIPFEAPDAIERAKRLSAVAAMIYLIFNEGYSASGGESHIRKSLCDEAIRLGRLLLRLFPSDPEIMGLLALMLLTHARMPARLDAAGGIILLEDQDRSLWHTGLITEGIALVEKAARHRAAGFYQLQAAIAALHASAKRAEDTDWRGIALLYERLEAVQPSPVVRLNRAVAVFKANDAETALMLLEPVEDELARYFYSHGVRGALLQELGQKDAAREAFNRAIALARTPAEARHIRERLDGLEAMAKKRKRPVSAE